MKAAMLVLAFAALSSAHFLLNYPPSRGFDDDQSVNYPCGGQPLSSNRTQVPIGSAFPIQLDMHHTASLVTVVLALGNDPQPADFNTLLQPTVQEDGPQAFCLGGIMIPSSVAPGSNGTIQVQTNGDGDSAGLYNCADVTFVSQPMSPEMFGQNCRNSTGVRSMAVSGQQEGKSANGTMYGSSTMEGGMASGSASAGTAGATGSASAAAGLKPRFTLEGASAVSLLVLMTAGVGASLI